MRTSLSVYATFNEINSFFYIVFNIKLLLARNKTAKDFHFLLSNGFQQKLANVVKKISDLIILNDPGFMNQVIDEVNCSEHPGVTSPGLFCKSYSLKILQKVHNVRGLFLLS